MVMEKQQNKPEQKEETLIRIMGTDIPGGKDVYSGLTKIKGISWSFSNFICNKLKMDKTKKISSLDEKDKEKIQDLIKNSDIPSHLVNRKNDKETGEDQHLIGSDLELKKEFDIKRLKKIKSHKGVRHSRGLPVRGQRTKGNFRKNKTVSVQKKRIKKE